MSIVASAPQTNFKPAPAGVALGVCCDVVDLGIKDSGFKDKDGKTKMAHKIRIVVQLADVDPEIGKRPIVSQLYTLSLHEKATLRRDLESWRGRPFTPEELKGFDVERVLGAPCFVNIVHNDTDKGTFANIAAIMPPPKGSPKVTVQDYVRVKDRAPEEREPGSDDGDESAQSSGW